MTFSVHFGSVLMAVKTSDIYIEQSYHIMYASTAGGVWQILAVGVAYPRACRYLVAHQAYAALASQMKIVQRRHF